MQRYIIALGSNRRHHRYGKPPSVLRGAVEAIRGHDLHIIASSPIINTRPIGPSARTYANSAVMIETDLAPPDLLGRLKAIEREFGARRGQRWGSRTLDLDIILWSGGAYVSRDLTVPHILFRERDFVLRPVLALVPEWIDPVTGRSIRQLFATLEKSRPKMVDRSASAD